MDLKPLVLEGRETTPEHLGGADFFVAYPCVHMFVYIVASSHVRNKAHGSLFLENAS